MSFRKLNSSSLLLALFVTLWVAAGASAFADSVARVSRKQPKVSLQPAAQIFLTRAEALALAFPKCKIQRSTVYLEPKQITQIAKLAKLEFKNAVVYPYRATRDGKWVGTAYFDTHRVRSLRESVMVVVKPNGTLGRIEVLSFGEPREYLPRAKWYAQFAGRKLDSDLNLGHKIRAVTGATLTSAATTRAARRVLALDAQLRKIEQAKIKQHKGPPKPAHKGASAHQP